MADETTETPTTEPTTTATPTTDVERTGAACSEQCVHCGAVFAVPDYSHIGVGISYRTLCPDRDGVSEHSVLVV